VVGLNSDASVRRLKGKDRPIQSEHARAEVLAALEAVDMVVVFEQNTPLELIRRVRPNVLVKGGDYRRNQVVGREAVEAQGGDPRVVDDPEAVLPAAPIRRTIVADRSGTLAAVQAEMLGGASGDLGAGRKKKGDLIDPAVGIVFRPKVGDQVEVGDELGEVHARTESDAEACLATIRSAVTLVEGSVEPPPLVYGWHG
jgi:thymidine phosphorylase